ncbi:MAG: surface-adhesin E family protein [Bacteroidales bacterium]
MRIIIIFLLLIFGILYADNTKAQSNRWMYIASSSDLIYDIYYDSETIRQNNDEITVSIKFDFENAASKNEITKTFEKQISKWVIFCGKDKYYIGKGVLYYKNGQMKEIIINEYNDVIPESIGEGIYRYFCK